MKYYGIVEEVQPNHRGLYYALNNEIRKSFEWNFNKRRMTWAKDEDREQREWNLEKTRNALAYYGTEVMNGLIFDNKFIHTYNISNHLDLFYGLFDGNSSKDKAFKTLMNSDGGSKLVIIG